MLITFARFLRVSVDTAKQLLAGVDTPETSTNCGAKQAPGDRLLHVSVDSARQLLARVDTPETSTNGGVKYCHLETCYGWLH